MIDKKAFKETPPRMRGRLLAISVVDPLNGNTPAYAGKTAAMAEDTK